MNASPGAAAAPGAPIVIALPSDIIGTKALKNAETQTEDALANPVMQLRKDMSARLGNVVRVVGVGAAPTGGAGTNASVVASGAHVDGVSPLPTVGSGTNVVASGAGVTPSPGGSSTNDEVLKALGTLTARLDSIQADVNNIGNRLTALEDKGGICFSKATYSDVERQLGPANTTVCILTGRGKDAILAQLEQGNRAAMASYKWGNNTEVAGTSGAVTYIANTLNARGKLRSGAAAPTEATGNPQTIIVSRDYKWAKRWRVKNSVRYFIHNSSKDAAKSIRTGSTTAIGIYDVIVFVNLSLRLGCLAWELKVVDSADWLVDPNSYNHSYNRQAVLEVLVVPSGNALRLVILTDLVSRFHAYLMVDPLVLTEPSGPQRLYVIPGMTQQQAFALAEAFLMEDERIISAIRHAYPGEPTIATGTAVVGGGAQGPHPSSHPGPSNPPIPPNNNASSLSRIGSSIHDALQVLRACGNVVWSALGLRRSFQV